MAQIVEVILNLSFYNTRAPGKTRFFVFDIQFMLTLCDFLYYFDYFSRLIFNYSKR